MNLIYHHINLNVRVLLEAWTLKVCLGYSHLFLANKALPISSSFKISFIWFVVLGAIVQNGIVRADVGLYLHEHASVVTQNTRQDTAQNTVQNTVQNSRQDTAQNMGAGCVIGWP